MRRSEADLAFVSELASLQKLVLASEASAAA